MEAGTWEQANLTLARKGQVQAGRNESPTLAIIDGQSVQDFQGNLRNG